MLVNAAPLPQHMAAAHLAGVLLLVHHGPAVLRRVVLHRHVVLLLDVVAHLAVGVEHGGGAADPALVDTAVRPVRGAAGPRWLDGVAVPVHHTSAVEAV